MRTDSKTKTKMEVISDAEKKRRLELIRRVRFEDKYKKYVLMAEKNIQRYGLESRPGCAMSDGEAFVASAIYSYISGHRNIPHVGNDIHNMSEEEAKKEFDMYMGFTMKKMALDESRSVARVKKNQSKISGMKAYSSNTTDDCPLSDALSQEVITTLEDKSDKNYTEFLNVIVDVGVNAKSGEIRRRMGRITDYRYRKLREKFDEKIALAGK